VSSQYSHTLFGLLYFDIPVTIVLSFLFHEVVKRNLIRNLPSFFQLRFQPLLDVDFKKQMKEHFWVVIISAGVGAFTHIFWDAFTHNDGFFAQRISFYKHIVIPFDGVRYPLFYGLQQISTFVGLTIVLFYILLMRPNKNVSVYYPTFFYWLLVLIIAGGVLYLRFFFDSQSMDLGNFVVSSISAILVAILVCGFIKFKNQVIT